MTWVRALAVGFAVAAVGLSVGLSAPGVLVVVQGLFALLGVRGAWALRSDPALAFWLLVVAAVGTPLFLILAVPAALAWRRAARPPAPRPLAPAR